MFPVDGYSPNLKLSHDSEIYTKVVRSYGHTKSVIAGYENALLRILCLLTDTSYNFSSSGQPWSLHFRNPQFIRSSIYPINAVEQPWLSYTTELEVEIIIERSDGIKMKIKTSMGKFPIMTRSRYDLLTYDDMVVDCGDIGGVKTGGGEYNISEAIRYGEDPDSPGSSFVMEGRKRVFNMFEMLRVNKILVYPKKIKEGVMSIISTITTESDMGKTALITMEPDAKGVVKFSTFREFSSSYMNKKEKKNNLNVLEMFRIYSLDRDGIPGVQIEDVESFILQFVREDWRNTIRKNLTPTINDYYMSNNDLLLKKIKIVKGRKDINSLDLLDYLKSIDQGLYIHIDKTKPLQKLILLVLQLIRLLEVKAGLRRQDERDDYSNKRFKNVGDSIFHLFGLYLEERIDGIRSGYNPYIMKIDDIVGIIDGKKFTESCVSSWKGNWGLKGHKNIKKSVYFEELKDEQWVLHHYHVDKVVKETNIHTKSYKIRGVRGTQVGMTDISETPESAKVGLNLTKALTEWNNIYSNDKIILQVLYNYENDNLVLLDEYILQDDYNTFLLVNAIPVGICIGKKCIVKLKEDRYDRVLPSDICIYYSKNEMTIYINTEGGRPTRPLYTVNRKTGKLILEERGLENTTNIQELMFAGAIVFVDALEQEYSVIAESRKHIETARFTLQLEEEKSKRLQSVLDSEENFYRSLEDPVQYINSEQLDREEEKKFALITQINDEAKAKLLILANELESLIINNNIDNFQDRYKIILGQITATKEILDRNDPRDVRVERNKIIANTDEIKTQMIRAEKQLALLKKRMKYDYCEIDSNAIFGITSSLLPFLNKNPAPRQTFGCKMIKQAQGIANVSQRWRFVQIKSTIFPSRPIVETQIDTVIGMHRKPTGIPILIAVLTGDGYSIEDGIIISKAFVESMGFASVYYKTITSNFESQPKSIDGKKMQIIISDKLPEEIIKKRKKDAFRNLDVRGVVRPGAILNIGDCILGRYQMLQSNDGEIQYIDISIYVKRSKIGTVKKVIFNKTNPMNTTLFVEIEEIRIPELGDKFSPRHAQKGVITRVLDKMPYSISAMSKGCMPDILINPHAFPSRMTIGMLEEILYSKVGILLDERIDGTAFREPTINAKEVLEEFGYNSNGNEQFINPENGELYETEIFSGVCYYHRLVHESRDKVQYRHRGNYRQDTHQPVTGIDNEGGIKYGEMEQEGLMSHGNAFMIKEFSTRNSDYYIVFSCERCNTVVYKRNSNIYQCPNCNTVAKLNYSESSYTKKLLRYYMEQVGIEMKYKFKQQSLRSVGSPMSSI